MKEYLFIIKGTGKDKNGNSLQHVYAAWRYKGEPIAEWRNFTPNELKELEFGRIVKGEYITTQLYAHQIIEKLADEYKHECSFLYL